MMILCCCSRKFVRWRRCSDRIVAFFWIVRMLRTPLLVFALVHLALVPNCSRTRWRISYRSPKLDHLFRGTGCFAADSNVNDKFSRPTEDNAPTFSHFTKNDMIGPQSVPAAESKKSFISQMRSHHLAGFVNSSEDEEIVISFSGDDPFIVVTGESASGKSLFLVRALELLTGTSSAAAKTYVTPPASFGREEHLPSTAFVEVQVYLVDPHWSALEAVLLKLKIDFAEIDSYRPGTKPSGKFFTFRRTLQWVPTVATSQETSTKNKYRFQSSCSINGQTVTTRKDFFALTRPLFALVDATIAVNQILSPAGGLRRTQILDAAVSRDALRQLQQSKRQYVTCRRRRRQYEQELQQQTSSTFLFGDASDEQQDRQLQLLSHYVTELDRFESRVTQFCQAALLTSPVVAGEEDAEQMSAGLINLGYQLSQTTWGQNSNVEASASKNASKKGKNSAASSSFVSKMYLLLLEFRNAVQTMEGQHRMAQDVVNALSSPVTSSNSALGALRRTRKLLIDIVENDDNNEALQSSTEQVHELLNQIEDSIKNCTQFIETNEEYGLLPILQSTRDAFAPQVSLEHVDDLLQEWKSLSRKHNVSPYLLPWCHANYKRERDGTSILATELLPRAHDNERIAAKAYRQAYARVTQERQQAAQYLSESLTDRYLPDLGIISMKNQTVFAIETAVPTETSDDASPPLTVDTTNFVLLSPVENQTTHSRRLVHEVASAGERARILLALECALPGAIGAALQSRESIPSQDEGDDTDMEVDEDDDAVWYMYSSLPPITIVYDEIDSHVGGGRAVQSVTRCLLQQSRQGYQIVSITHNPTVAAAAQTHIIVQRITSTDRDRSSSTNSKSSSRGSLQSMVSVCTVDSSKVDEERRIQELVRMVGGDYNAANYLEAMTFVKSLIRNSRSLSVHR